MSSVRNAEAEDLALNIMSLTGKSLFSDELRHPFKSLWPTADQFALAGTIANWIQRHGIAVIQLCQKFWLSGSYICGDRVLH